MVRARGSTWSVPVPVRTNPVLPLTPLCPSPTLPLPVCPTDFTLGNAIRFYAVTYHWNNRKHVSKKTTFGTRMSTTRRRPNYTVIVIVLCSSAPEVIARLQMIVACTVYINGNSENMISEARSKGRQKVQHRRWSGLGGMF